MTPIIATIVVFVFLGIFLGALVSRYKMCPPDKFWWFMGQ